MKSESSVLQNRVWDFQNSEYLKNYRDCTTFSETQAKETWEKDFKTMKNENKPIWTIYNNWIAPPSPRKLPAKVVNTNISYMADEIAKF